MDLGSAPIGSAAWDAIEGHIDDGDWEALPFIFSGGAVFRAIRCPGGNGAIIPLDLATSVLGDDIIVGRVYRLGAGQLRAIRQEIGPWPPYASSWSTRSQTK
jgi:hypothetical protein